MKQQKYYKEEYHRGEWIPLIVTNKNNEQKEQARVFITEQEANEMNMYSDEYKIRYVLADEKEDSKIKEIETESEEVSKQSIEEARAEYTEKVGKKPFGGWDFKTIKEKQKEELSKK